MSWFWATFAVLATLAAGDTLARATCTDAAMRRGLAGVFGPAVIAFVLFLLSLAGVPLSPIACRLVGCVAIAAWLLRAWRTRTRAIVVPSTTSALERLACAAVPAACLALGFAFVLFVPPANDAFSNWGLKALALARDGSVRTPDLFEDGRFLFHPNYPLLVPLAQAFVHACAAGPAESAARVVFLLAQLGAGLVLFSALRTRVGSRVAALAGAMLVTTPHFWRSALDLRFPGSIPAGYADPMFTALVAATIATALAWASRPSARAAAALGACLGFALFTKNEGQPLTLALIGATLVAGLVLRLRGRPSQELRSLAAAVVVAGAIATPWFVFRAELPARDENYQQQITREKVEHNAWRGSVIVTVAVGEALAVDRHGLTWIALAVALALRIRRVARADVAFLLATLFAMTSAYAIVFVVTPLPIVDSLATSIPRTFFHLTPVALAAIALLCGPREVEA